MGNECVTSHGCQKSHMYGELQSDTNEKLKRLHDSKINISKLNN